MSYGRNFWGEWTQSKKIKCITFKRKGCDACCLLVLHSVLLFSRSYFAFSPLHIGGTAATATAAAKAQPSQHQAEEGKEGGRGRRSLRKTIIQLGRGSPQIPTIIVLHTFSPV